jgi:hypothetical protein
MVEAIFDYLLNKQGSYLDETVDHIQDVFRVDVSTDSLRRILKKNKWSKKIMQQKAKEQNPDLQDKYQHDISEYHSYQLVYVDKSGCDRQTGIRKTGWSPLGITPTERSKFHHGQYYQILPAYSQDGIVLSHIYQGSTNTALFGDFINQLLHHCRQFPGPRSVLIMDNTVRRSGQRIAASCRSAGGSNWRDT